jgi:hypothetical protein
MTGLWIALAVLAPMTLVLALLWRRGRAARAPGSIANLESDTSFDAGTGGVRSVQRADLLLPADALAELWTPMNLERLARTYWRFLTRVTLGLIRVHYTREARFVVLLARPFKLLTFDAPEYEMDATHGLVRWGIARGLLVSQRGRKRGHLQIDVRRSERPRQDKRVCLHVELEVANFYPSIASRLSLRVYNATQSRIHVIVTYAFLRSLARLDLAESRVGQLL